MGLLPATLMANTTQPKDTGSIEITITGFKNSNGVAKVALVNSEENYDAKAPFEGYNFKIFDNKVVKIISNLPYGEYAIKVFHDENANDKLDKRIFGIPAESYGFSNNVRAQFGPPAYQDAKFELNAPVIHLEIEVR